mmetsp:Transcript_31666/g.48118  ORF Transcript_31666/g.48118 Transcript_31666/m.48118 type:complete len:169 (-) Transcript_31666:1453-1959(-)
MKINRCVLSYENNTCVQSSSDEDVAISFVFDEAFLAGIYNITGHLINRVESMVFDETHDLGRLPCTHGVISRLMFVDVQECNAANLSAVNNDTRMAFESLLHYSVDDNPHMCDIVMYEENHYNGQMCTASDVNATDFVVKVAKDGVCVKNVHPDLWYVTLFSCLIRLL